MVKTDPEAWWIHAENITATACFVSPKLMTAKKIVFEANPNYWGGRPKLDRIEFVYNNDPAASEQYQRAN